MINPLTGKALIAEYKRRYSGTTLLAFSTGKDSIATALAIRDYLTVIPVYYVLVPGLTFIEEGLDYYERKLFGRPIIRLPHPALYRHLNNFLYQPVGRAEVIAAANLPSIDYPAVNRMAIEQEGITAKCISAVGVRAVDSPLRRMSINKHGPIRSSSQAWYPVWNWNKARLIAELTKAAISLPIDYKLFGRSFDGLDARFLVPLKRERPQDYAKVLAWYPLADAEVFRYEMHQRAR